MSNEHEKLEDHAGLRKVLEEWDAAQRQIALMVSRISGLLRDLDTALEDNMRIRTERDALRARVETLEIAMHNDRGYRVETAREAKP